MHERVERQGQLSTGEIPPCTGGALPYLWQLVHPLGCVDIARDDEEVSICQRRVRRVPAPCIHVGKTNPGVAGGVIGRRVRQADVVADVASGHQQPPVREKRVTCAERVVPRPRRGRIPRPEVLRPGLGMPLVPIIDDDSAVFPENAVPDILRNSPGVP